MQLKLMRGKEEVEHFACRHVEIKSITESSPDDLPLSEGGGFDPKLPLVQRQVVAIRFQISPPRLPDGRPAPTEEVELPRDGDTVYLMNDRGDTTDTYRWPPKES